MVNEHYVKEYYMSFEGWDSLELYLDDNGNLMFRQEFGGHNILSIKDVIELRDLCNRYLKNKGIE